ncbi:O-methyltransferase [Actinokineospora cianjurensis]|uniref:Putative O-methyltransferase YrrM n=1 Tax=Actinokineospora cianjurensis TaxID=585224 RepID=A0A421B2K1_9PSEU|nr:O-methyltransferase [Actinokineospora cianjurensis]RLK58621.1 putative O-methyltransferase YrrM [Actinokineospora cianjurensis]
MSDQQLWTAVDDYLVSALLPPDPALDDALRRATDAGLPEIAVAPNQGRLLNLIARVRGARRVLEIGTLGGYSTIWLARALPQDGRVVTLEFDPRHAAVARENIAAAGLAGVVEVLVGPALETLPTLTGPFDVVFVDADKDNNPAYFEWAMRLTAPGSVIIIDNVVRGGRVADPDDTSPAVVGTRRMHELIRAESRVAATAVQTVGEKGHDGFTLVYREA